MVVGDIDGNHLSLFKFLFFQLMNIFLVPSVAKVVCLNDNVEVILRMHWLYVVGNITAKSIGSEASSKWLSKLNISKSWDTIVDLMSCLELPRVPFNINGINFKQKRTEKIFEGTNFQV